jgi:putative hydrolase of HD superfamily
MAEKSQDILNGLIKLQRNYSFTYRAIVTEEKYKNVVESGLLKKVDFTENALRETLIEHVGNLPIVAAYLHQFIENKDNVDLGNTLAILSVHDIGETEVGDMFCFAKTKAHAKDEEVAAKKLLPSYQFKLFEEYERGDSLEAKFARAVDKIAPLIHEIMLPDVTAERFKIYNYDTNKIIEKRIKYFEWDRVLKGLFECVVEEFRKIG